MSELGWGDVRKQAVPVDDEPDVFVEQPMYEGPACCEACASPA